MADIMHDPDIVYYNLVLNNIGSNTEIIPMRFQQQIVCPFIIKPDDWNVSIVRFNIPNYFSPLFTFQDTTYYVTLKYSTYSVRLPVVYQSRYPDPNARYVFEVQHMIDMINTTLASCLTALNIVHPTGCTEPPYLIYDNVTQLISLIAPKAYYDVNLSIPITISVDYLLFKFLDGLPASETTDTDAEFQLLVQDAKNNTYDTNYWIMTQQHPSLDIYSDFQSIQFTTNLPIRNEFVGEQDQQAIIQDYMPNDLNINTFHNHISFTAVYPFRFVNLMGAPAITNISFTVYMVKNDGSREVMQIPNNDAASIKLMFVKKRKF